MFVCIIKKWLITGGLIILPFIQKWQLSLLSSVASCYIKRKNKWVDKDINSFLFGSFINSLRWKEPLCWKKKTVVELRRNKDAEVKAGVDVVVGTGIKMLKSKQELKISNLFLLGSVGLGEMNDKRMISQTPMVHKLDVISS